MKSSGTAFLVALFAVSMFMLFTANPTLAQTGTVIAASVPSEANPDSGAQITVDINIDMSGVNPPDDKLGSFTASLDWDPAVLRYAGNSGWLAGLSGQINETGAGTGRLVFSGSNAMGVGGAFTAITITFKAWGSDSSGTDLDLEFSAMAATFPFNNLLPILSVTDGHVHIGAVGECEITVTSPNGGETWCAGMQQDITWTSANTSGEVCVQYSTNAGATWLDVVCCTPDDGSELWTIPDLHSDTCLVKVYDCGNPGCADTSNGVFTICDAPQATFSADPQNSQGQTCQIQFTDESVGCVTGWQWDFGDDGTSTEQHPTHTYTCDGPYTVRLTVSGPCGQDTETKTSYISCTCPTPCEINVISPNGGEVWCAGTQYNITWTSQNTGGVICLYYSTNGGGNWILIAASQADDGSYPWTIPDLHSDNCLVRIYDCGAPSCDDASDGAFTICGAPQAAFSADPQSSQGQTCQVQFTDESVGCITSWQWDFGDDGSSTVPNPTHTYTCDGPYTVRLTVSGSCGQDTETKTSYIHCSCPTTCEINVISPNGGEVWCVGTQHNITWTSQNTGGSICLYYSTDGGRNWILIAASQADDGSYPWTIPDLHSDNCLVRLYDCGDPGCTDASDGVFTICDAPQAAFSADPQSSQGQTCQIQFTDESVGCVTDWQWDFGDDGTSTVPNPTHTYTCDGPYTVSLTVSGPCGQDTETKTSYINCTCPLGGGVTAESVPSDENPAVGDPITVDINIDMTGVNPPDEKLGNFTASLNWDPTVLCYTGNSGLLAGFTGTVNEAIDYISFNGLNPAGAGGPFTVLTITFFVCGLEGSETDLDLEFSSMTAALTFADLLPILTVTDVHVQIPSPECISPDLVRPTDFSGYAGDRIYTDITIDQNQNPIQAFGLELSFDNSVLYFDTVTACDLTWDWTTLNGSEQSPGIIRIGGYDYIPIPLEATGCIARVFFHVLSCPPGDITRLCTQHLVDDLAHWEWPCCASFTCSSIPCHIEVTSPAETEVLCVGLQYTIRWTAVDCQGGEFEIWYSADGGNNWTPVGTTGSNSYQWTIPDDPSDNCLVKVCCVGEEPACCANSGVFTISTCGECTPPDLIRPTDFSGNIGDRVYTDIVIYQNQIPIDAFALDLTYDNSILAFDKIDSCDLTEDWRLVGGSENTPGIITVGGYNLTEIPLGTTGCIARVFFNVRSCTPGDISRLCTQDFVDDLMGWEWPCCGTFTCTACLRGDVNCDGSITPGDALCAFWRSILGSFQMECACECSEQAAEINCDGSLTPGDALCIFWRSILGDWTEECECLSTKVAVQGPTVDRLTVESLEGIPGETVKVPIIVENPQGLDAFALQLSYPADLLEFQYVSSTAITEDWTALDGVLSDQGIVTIGGLHTEGIIFEGTVAIAELTFTVREGATGQGEFDLTYLADDLTGVDVKKGSFVVRNLPTAYSLSQNYPNPFNPNTTIAYALPGGERRAENGGRTLPPHVSLKIYNILGQEMRTLVDEVQEPGYYSVTWDGQDGSGQVVSSGIYFYRLMAGGTSPGNRGEFSVTKRMVFVR